MRRNTLRYCALRPHGPLASKVPTFAAYRRRPWRGTDAPPILAPLHMPAILAAILRDRLGVGNGEKDAQESRCESGEDIKSLNQEERRQEDGRQNEKRDKKKTAQGRGAEKIESCCEEKAYCEKNTGPQKSPQAAAGEFRAQGRGRIHRGCRHADGRRAAAP